jgi:hypothetical protein
MRDLTIPITSIDTNRQYVSEGKYQLVLNAEGGINMDASYYQYVVTNLPSGEYAPYKIAAIDLPVSFRAKLKEIHNIVVTHAENTGLLHPGTDTDDL